MRTLLLLCATGPLLAAAPAEPAKADLAAHIHRLVTEKMPRQFEDLSEWGATIPAPAVVRFPRLKRTVLKVGDNFVVPHGTWKRTKVWMTDPAKDLRVRVIEVRKAGKQTTRLRVEATAAVRGERERVQWAKGVQLFAVTAEADAVVVVGVDLDVTMAFDIAKPLAGMKFAVKVADVRLDLKSFDLRRVGPVVIQDQSSLGDELKGKLRERLKTLEPKIKDQANRAIGEAGVDGKSLLPAAGGK